MTDYFLYTGNINEVKTLDFMESVAKKKKSDVCTVLITSRGGDPNAAYKMSRYLQYKYTSYSGDDSGCL